ncbi:MAG: hypothetical protein H6920_07135 [Sphingomonadaceae bacterium]|nr:hypothetical protein [Sphingomonadaceae bacterium]MCP5384280.1 hypothetical protein [Altererythrobacter sp.]MCP5391378.1 hypothetical protein [Sphingomonadaceae bacterium]MCP5393607.1 hypothetical protein [Sphingomonadaceae bacterium]
MKLIRVWLSLAAAVGIAVSAPAMAQEKAGVRPGFEETQIAGEKIVLFRPDIKVGEQSMGGLFEPRAEWTDTARELIGAELERAQVNLSNELVKMPELDDEDAELLDEYQALFDTVSDSIIEYQFFPGNRLPTRKGGDFDWTLGPGTSRLAELSGARYGLFIMTEDQYGSTGRKIAQLFIGVQSGVHKGAAGLVDLQTGHVLWMNADLQMGGDVRDAEGVKKRVRQLLEDFPGSTPAAE